MQALNSSLIRAGDVVLFAGDSITDAFRKPEEPIDAYQLGSGYALMSAAHLQWTRPADALRFYNRGLSGKTVRDLCDLWPQDVLPLQPSVISLLVGINDAGQEVNGDTRRSPEQYARDYRALLQQSRDALPEVRFVLCEPFTLVCGRVDARWLEPVRQRQQIVAALAREFEALLVPLQQEFDAMARKTSPSFWIYDGIHPTAAGHQLIADTWLAAVRQPVAARRQSVLWKSPQRTQPGVHVEAP